MFVKEYDEFHIKDRLYIYWDITSKCNYNCDYCYARHHYNKNEWQKEISFNKQLLILKSLSLSPLPLYLGFQGGEPLLNSRFFDLLDETLKLKNLDNIYIATNGSCDNSIFRKFEKYKNNKKLRVMLSYHCTQCKKIERFIKNVEILNSFGIKTKVNVLLVQDNRYYNKIKYVFETCSKITKVHPHFIYDCVNEDEVIREYSEDFFKQFDFIKQSQCYYVFEEENGVKKRFTDYDVFKNKFYNFKDWKCYMNNYEIFLNGDFHKLCTDKVINVLEDPLYFKRIKSIEPIICKETHCYSDGVLKCLKTKY